MWKLSKTLKVESGDLISFAVILITLMYLFRSFLFLGLEPAGVDSIASEGSSHAYLQYEKSSGETVLWNPGIFCGMPAYPRRISNLLMPDTLINFLGRVSDWRFLYFLIAALGMYFYLKYLKMPWYWALAGAVSFILLPHWQALVEVGHNTKLRAFMVLPWFVFSFHAMFDRARWFNAGLFALVFSWLIRTQHFQVVFYALLILIFMFIVPYIKLLMARDWMRAGKLLAMLAAASVLTIMTAAQPFLTIRDYTPYSTRGGNAVSLNSASESAQKSDGVDFEYATRWSLAPAEILNFMYPRLFGGYSAETYDGTAYPQLRGRQIPGYWGQMPFTQSYDSVGLLILLFAILGLFARRKDLLAKSLAVFAVFSVLLAMGRHLPGLYRLFFLYLPYFSKFRVPGMIVNATFFSLIILAVMGLQALPRMLEGREKTQVFSVLGAGFIFTLLLLLFRDGFAFTVAREAGQYNGQTLAIIRGIRREIFTDELTKGLIFSGAALLAVALYTWKRIRETTLILALLVLISAELFIITNRANKNMSLQNHKQVEYQTFHDTDISRYLEKQDKNARIFTLGREFQSNYYAYFYPMVTGYSAIKMQSIQDVMENILFLDKSNRKLNWPVLDMLGARYIVSPAPLSDAPFLQPVIQDKGRQEILFENPMAFPKAWLVDSLSAATDEAAVLRQMKAPSFLPEQTAYCSGTDESRSYDRNGRIDMTSSMPDRLNFDVKMDKPGFAVFSEMWYPGWTLRMGDEDLPLLKVNHLLRGAELPAGSYSLVMEFHPHSYYLSSVLVWIGNLAILLLLGITGYDLWRKRTLE